MAAHQNFNLDLLGSTTRFEQLCYALLVHYFGSEITPYGALGPDGGIDARLNGLPGSYSFEGIPLIHGARQVKKSGYWVFQAKYHQSNSSNKTPLTDLNKELKLWKKRKPKPDYFFFMTNIVFTPAIHKEFLKFAKKPKPFKFFDYWDGSKIEALIAANQSIRIAFFPNCEDHGGKLDEALKGISDIQKTVKTEKKRPTKKKKQTATKKKVSEKQTYITSVEELAKYEGAFANANNEIVSRFKKPEGDIPKTWKQIDILSPGKGILQLSNQGQELIHKLIAASESESFVIRLWHYYLGEQVEKGEKILSISYDPEDEDLVNLAKSSLFAVAPGKIDLHIVIDKKVKSYAQKAISALKENDSFEVEAALKELFKLRSEYIEARRQYGVGFFPNYRHLGRIGFGWSFLRVWDDAFERASDILLSGTQPDDLYRLFGNIPSALADKALDSKLPPEEVLSELNTLSLLLFKAEERKATRFRSLVLEDIENVFEHFHDLEHQIKTMEDAEWASSISYMLADFAAELWRFSLSKKLSVDQNFVTKLVGLATSIHYVNHSSGIEGEDWQKTYTRLKALDASTSDLQSEMTFAFGTYAWSLARQGRKDLVEVAVGKLNSLPLKKIVELYERGQRLRRWYHWWFMPEGKRVVWSSRVDHDIREALLLRIALTQIKFDEIIDLRLLETQGAVDDFVKDLNQIYQQMKELKIPVGASIEDNERIIVEAKKEVDKRREEQIRSETSLSQEKIESTRASFKEFIQKHDSSGVLYQIKTNNNPEFKSTHGVGTYMLYDKEWFLEDKGYVAHSVHGMGSSWGENLILGRESLLAEELKKHVTFEKIKIDDIQSILEMIRDKYTDKYVLLAHTMSVPWHIRQNFFLNEHQLKASNKKFTPGQIARVGEVDVFSSRRLLKGQMALFPKNTFTWLTKQICSSPEIRQIDPASDEGLAILKKNPKIDLALKVIIEARELGTMTFSEESHKGTKAWKIAGKDEDLM